MASPVNLTVIGAGSATFSVGVIRDICLQESLSGSKVTLMDIDAHRLQPMQEFGQRYAAELGADVTFNATTDREIALRGADFVLNSAQYGGHTFVEDFREWSEQNGYYRGFGLLACLNIRLMLDVARDMERLCPQAWLIQAGNPVFEGCTATTRETAIKVVGICHGHLGYHRIAEVLGLEVARVRAQAIGFNHFIWLTHFEYEGRDALPVLNEWIEQKSQAYWRDHRPHFMDSQMSPAAVALYRLAGLFPVGDTVRGGGWWFHTDLATKKRWYGEEHGGFDSEIGWGRYLAGLDQHVARIHSAVADKSTRLTDVFPPGSPSEEHFPLVDAIVNDQRCELQVNVPNRGAIEGITDDVVVEVPATCSIRGVQPYQVGKLPDKLMVNWMWPRLNRAERLISLATDPDASTLLAMILDDHRTSSYEQAVRFMRAALERPGFTELKAEMERNGGIPEYDS